MTFSKGDRVRVRNKQNDYRGTVELISDNNKALAVTFGGEEVAIRHSHGIVIASSLPLMQGKPGHFQDLWGEEWIVEIARTA